MIKLGVIGFSEGNGHPYSWSAIFNGYNKEEMATCGYPVIGDYLSKQNFPTDFLTEKGKVTHVYAQNKTLAEKVKVSALVEHSVEYPEDLIGKVDAILLARDDAENHANMAKPFLDAGLPIFIDKPFALSKADAESMLSWQRYESQIFTCSALRYANEMLLSDEELNQIGTPQYIEAIIPKYWDTYAVHVIEPILVNCKQRGDFLKAKVSSKKNVHISILEWNNLIAKITCTGTLPSPLAIVYFGEKGNITKTFLDTFSCFKKSLQKFLEQVDLRKQIIPRKETLEVVKIIECGRKQEF